LSSIERLAARFAFPGGRRGRERTLIRFPFKVPYISRELLAFPQVVLFGKPATRLDIACHDRIHDRAVLIDDHGWIRDERVAGPDIHPDLLLNKGILNQEALMGRTVDNRLVQGKIRVSDSACDSLCTLARKLIESCVKRSSFRRIN
jgi:hypothetical protein